MTYGLYWEPHFTRRVRAFLRRHPDLHAAFNLLLEDLASEPFPERIHVHALSGKQQGLFAASLSRSYRVTFRKNNDDKLIELVNIGTHDEVYG